jgi:ABC-type phosphate/phosphonate transport system substrate-binding protein
MLVALAVAMVSLGCAQAGLTQETTWPTTVRVGMAESLCRDTPRPILLAMVPPFRSLMRSLTGLECDLNVGVPAPDLGERLAGGKLQLGLFQGIDYAWAFQKDPQLRPLAVVVNEKPYLRALLVVAADSAAAGFADLKGQSLAVPRHSHEHCYQFLGRCCREQGSEPRRFLSELAKPDNAEDALDDVVDGVVGAAVVEEVPLEHFRRRKPGRYARLKVLRRSEKFPASVVAYRAGDLDEQTLKKLRDGMLAAHRDPVGRQFLTWWRMTAFESIPAEYEQTLRDIVKIYASPNESSERDRVDPAPSGDRP